MTVKTRPGQNSVEHFIRLTPVPGAILAFLEGEGTLGKISSTTCTSLFRTVRPFLLLATTTLAVLAVGLAMIGLDGGAGMMDISESRIGWSYPGKESG